MKTHIIISTLAFLLTINSCEDPCHELPSLRYTSVSFVIIDSLTGKSLLPDTLSLPFLSMGYHIDSIKVFDESNQLVNSHYEYRGSQLGYVASFPLFDDGEDIYLPGEKIFFIKLSPVDFDTLRLDYDYDPKGCSYKVVKQQHYVNGTPVGFEGTVIIKK